MTREEFLKALALHRALRSHSGNLLITALSDSACSDIRFFIDLLEDILWQPEAPGHIELEGPDYDQLIWHAEGPEGDDTYHIGSLRKKHEVRYDAGSPHCTESVLWICDLDDDFKNI